MVDQQIQEIDSVLGQVAECRDHVEQCVDFGSSRQVLSTKPQIMSYAHNVIVSVRDKTFQPLEQPDIQLVKSDTIYQIHSNIWESQVQHFLPAKVHVSHRHVPSDQ